VMALFSDPWRTQPVVGQGLTPWVPTTGNVYASASGGGFNMFAGDPSDKRYGSEGAISLWGNVLVNSVEPVNPGDLRLRNRNSIYNFSDHGTINTSKHTQFTPYQSYADNGSEVNWSSNSPYSSMVTSNGSMEFTGSLFEIYPPMPPIGAGPYTISLWFYPTFEYASNTLLGGGTGALTLLSQSWANLIITTGDPTKATGFDFGTTLALNTWYHLVVTRDSAQRCQAWLNGSYLSGLGGYINGVDINDYKYPISYIAYGEYAGGFRGSVTDVKIDNTNLYSTWGPGNSGAIPIPTAPAVPGYSTQLLISATDSANVYVNSANTIIYTPFTIASVGAELAINSDGSISLPPRAYGNISIAGTVTTVGGVYPAWSTPNATEYIWQASSTDVTSFKMTVRAQHNDPSTCVEMADITAALDSQGGLFYSVGNRVKSNLAAQDTAFGVVVDSGALVTGNVMTVNASVGSDTVYFTYSVTEFMTSHAN